MDNKAANLGTSQPSTHVAGESKEAGEKTNVVVSRPPVSKGYRTQNPKVAGTASDESEGESENEDPSVIWRGLTQSDLTNLKQGRGLVAATTKTDAALYEEIREHVENGSKEEHHCDLMSATRSKKVAARYASHKAGAQPRDPIRHIAKIKLDATTKSIDLTNPVERTKAGLEGTVEKFANNSQEVIICSSIPKENIMGVYSVQNFWLNKTNPRSQQEEAEYQRAKESAAVTTSFVKFRAYERNAYYGFVIKKSSDYTIESEQKEARERDKISGTPSTPGARNPVKKEAETPQSPGTSESLAKQLEAANLGFEALPVKDSQQIGEQPPPIISAPSLAKLGVPTALDATAKKLDCEQGALPVSPILIASPARKHRKSDP